MLKEDKHLQQRHQHTTTLERKQKRDTHSLIWKKNYKGKSTKTTQTGCFQYFRNQT